MAKVKHPFDEAALESWKQSFQDSPAGKYKCECGHPVFLESKHWFIEKHWGKWVVKVNCAASCVAMDCGATLEFVAREYTSKLVEAQCKRTVSIPIPRDPRDMVAPPYPQHPSTAWRDQAEVLPSFGGAYAYQIAKSKNAPPDLRFADKCLLFNDRGAVFDTNVVHSGYQGTFAEQALSHAPKQDKSGGFCRRGLYSVVGRKVTCVIPEFNGLEYRFTGEISRDGKSMKLKRTGGPESGGLSGTFTFHAIPGWPPAGAPSLPQPPAAVIRHAVPAPAAPAPAPVAATSSSGTASNGVTVGQELFDVVLEAHGNKQVQVIKAVRVVTPLGLREAKSLVDSVPSLVLRQVDHETAAKAKALLDQAGGRAVLGLGPQLSDNAGHRPAADLPAQAMPHRRAAPAQAMPHSGPGTP